MICYFVNIKIVSFWPKNIELRIVRHFDQIYFHPHNSSLEGATELKLAPLYSS